MTWLISKIRWNMDISISFEIKNKRACKTKNTPFLNLKFTHFLKMYWKANKFDKHNHTLNQYSLLDFDSCQIGQINVSIKKDVIVHVTSSTSNRPHYFMLSRTSHFLTWDKFVIPSKKQIASKIFDFPLPFKPVIALNKGSKPLISVRWA